MKLLDSHTSTVREFLEDDDIPQYVILSHTWGDKEVTYGDMCCLPTIDVKQKAGYGKIKYACEQAVKDGIKWVWVDTCCIDKSSSAELSEAINSMFRWYQNAKVCYVYLEDVSRSPIDGDGAEFAASRWFTRGWTLQEMLAPKSVIFYGQNWMWLGTRTSLCDTISAITNIEPRYLNGENLEEVSVAKKMSWASNRKTKRLEDTAYCLLGIFDVHMPPIYGEGKKAFRRLQEEILRKYPRDHTIFAWGAVSSEEPGPREYTDPLHLDSPTPIPPWDENQAGGRLLRGLLADGPWDFASSGNFTPWHDTARYERRFQVKQGGSTPVIVTGSGISVCLPTVSKEAPKVYHWPQQRITQIRDSKWLLLLCGYEGELEPTVWVPLLSWGDDFWGRTDELWIHPSSGSLKILMGVSCWLLIEPQTRFRLANEDVVLARNAHEDAKTGVRTLWNAKTSRYIQGEHVYRARKRLQSCLFGYEITIREFEGWDNLRFLILLYRLEPSDPTDGCPGPITAGLWPAFRPDDAIKVQSEYMDLFGVQWFNVKNFPEVFVHAGATVRRQLSLPDDVWEFDDLRLAFKLRIERMTLDEGGFVDVVDFVVTRIGLRPDTNSSPENNQRRAHNRIFGDLRQYPEPTRRSSSDSHAPRSDKSSIIQRALYEAQNRIFQVRDLRHSPQSTRPGSSSSYYDPPRRDSNSSPEHDQRQAHDPIFGDLV